MSLACLRENEPQIYQFKFYFIMTDVKAKEAMKAAKVTKFIGGDYKRVSLQIEGGKFQHIDKNEKLKEDNLITINPNQVFNVDVTINDDETAQIFEMIKIMYVGRQLKQYIVSAFLTNSVLDIYVIHANAGDKDPESGREYTSEEYSYRIDNVIINTLNPLAKRLIIRDIENGTIFEEKPKPTINSIFGNQTNIVL